MLSRPACLWLSLLQSAVFASNSTLLNDLNGAATQLQRNNLLQDSDFIFDFLAPSDVRVVGKDGHTTAANSATMPALLSEDVSITVGSIGPCGMNTPHTHPRATEFNYVVNGSFTTGMIQENGARVVLGNATAGQASLFPRGSIHFEANLGCTPATFIAAFSNPDPGVLQVAQGLFGLPASIVGATLGNDLSSNQLAILQSMIPANVAYGLDECIKRCGLPPVVGTTILTSDLQHLLKHSHQTGYAYGIFIGALVILWTLIHQLRKTAIGDAFRLSPSMRRYVTYAPTITLFKGVKVVHDPITIEFPSNLRSGMCLVFWLANIGLACWDLPDEKPPRELFQRVGWLAIWNMVGLVILAMKTSPLPYLLGRSHDGLVLYHKIMAITAFVEVWIHSVWGMYVIPASNPAHHFYWHKAQTGAWISTPAFTIIVLTAWSSWFVRKHFETFLATHVIGLVVLLIGLWLHNPLLKWYVVAVLALWSFDRIVRILRVAWLNRNARTELARLTTMDGAVKISFTSKSHWQAGSHIYINFPGCDPLQSHPYTIASISGHGRTSEIQLLVQGSGGHGFSEKLLKKVNDNGGTMLSRFIFHGPYGSAPDMKFYDRVLCIGGGSGITLPIAMIQAFLSVKNVDNRGKADLLWSAKSFSDFKRFDLLAMRAAGANIYLYETRAPKPMGIMPMLRRAATAMGNGETSANDNTVKRLDRAIGVVTGSEDIQQVGSRSQPQELTSEKDAHVSSTSVASPKLQTQIELMPSSTGDSSDEGMHHDEDSSDYQGTRFSQEAAGIPLVSPADAMPSFIASEDNRMILRQATMDEIKSLDRRMTDAEARNAADAMGCDPHTLMNGSLARAAPEHISVERLRDVFAPIGLGRPKYDHIVAMFAERARPKDRLCIVVCGNKSLCRSVRNAIALCKATQRIDLHVEEF